MTTITKEWLQQTIAKFENTRDDIVFGLDEDDARILEVLKRSLASMDSEPVAWDYEWASCITCEGPQDYKRIIEREAPPEWAIEEGQARNIIPLYATAAPAPAPIVPRERPADSSNGDDVEAWFDEGWNACRAAMLSGGDRG